LRSMALGAERSSKRFEWLHVQDRADVG